MALQVKMGKVITIGCRLLREQIFDFKSSQDKKTTIKSDAATGRVLWKHCSEISQPICSQCTISLPPENRKPESSLMFSGGR